MRNKSFSFFYFFSSILLLLIQSVQLFNIFGIRPDLVMLFMIIYTFSHGSFKGMIFGFILGFLLDLMSGILFGLNAFIFTLLASFITIFQRTVKLANILVFIFYIIIATTMKYLLYTVFYNLYEDIQLLDWYFILKIPGEIVINIIFSIFLYIITARFDTRDEYEWF